MTGSADVLSGATLVVSDTTKPPPAVKSDAIIQQHSNPKIQVFEGIRFTIPYYMQVVCLLSERAAIEQLLEEIFAGINAVFNVFNPNSELSRLNDSPRDTPIPVSDELMAVLQACDRANSICSLYDPTILPLQEYWNELLAIGRIPNSAEDKFKSLVQLIGWKDALILSRDSVTKRYDGVKLDLGGAAKGWAVDRLADRLLSAGFLDFLVEWGGEVKASGKHPEGRFWSVAVPLPPSLDVLESKGKGGPGDVPTRGVMTTADKSVVVLTTIPCNTDDGAFGVATSGDYMQVKRFGYFHIFDVSTQAFMRYNQEQVCSATVTSRSCLWADILATVSLLMKNGKSSHDCLMGAEKAGVSLLHFLLYSRSKGTLEKSKTISKNRPGLSADSLLMAMRYVPHFVALVTIVADTGEPYSIVVSSVHAVNGVGGTVFCFNIMNPSRFLQILASSEAEIIQPNIAIHVLGSQESKYASQFASGALKIQNVPTTVLPNGAVSVDSLSANVVECYVTRLYRAGDHFIAMCSSPAGTQSSPIIKIERAFFAMDPSLPIEEAHPAALLTSEISGIGVSGFPVYHMCSCSINPPMISFVARNTERMRKTLSKDGKFRLHLIGEDGRPFFEGGEDAEMSIQYQFAYIPTYPVVLLPINSQPIDCKFESVFDVDDGQQWKMAVASVIAVPPPNGKAPQKLLVVNTRGKPVKYSPEP